MMASKHREMRVGPIQVCIECGGQMSGGPTVSAGDALLFGEERSESLSALRQVGLSIGLWPGSLEGVEG